MSSPRWLATALPLVLALSACGGSSDETGDSLAPSTTSASIGTTAAPDTTAATAVTQPSAGERIQLPGVPSVGQTSRQTVTLAGAFTLDSPDGSADATSSTTIELVSVREVVGVDADSYQLDETFESASMQLGGEGENDPAAAAAVAAYEELAGVIVSQTIGLDGTLIDSEVSNAEGLSPDASALLDTPVAGFDANYPDQPVGVGDSWTATITSALPSIDLEVVYTIEVVAVTDDGYELSISFDQDVSDLFSDMGAESVEATVSGSGTITGSRSNPLLTTSTISTMLLAEITSGGQTGTLKQTIDNSTANAPV